MSTTQHIPSDSEDDEDYVPPAEEESSDSEPEAKRARPGSPPQDGADEEAKTKAREAAWASFQALASTPSVTAESASAKLIKVEKRYLFAGKEVTEVVDVPEDSPDAKKWPMWTAHETGAGSTATSTSTTSTSETAPTPNIEESMPKKPPLKKPGPRKSKTSLAPLPGPSKAKKITTLEKSAMDWKAHLQSQEEPVVKDELEANRRGGGYLEKVEFLKRVDDRKGEALDTLKSNKRRRG
ncbi:bucentaur or craniofacial development-domain-containing protein [Crucibulum laeve]|uniref:SWR1-complex protein 5 n=1 Tax=Crucibulum laeve TaxID=68775 RepID=A0A5C3MB07_9AGAR|nr:bucentaur or craniofacial development-domain-containing protein [Crucibulum laeve]